MFKVNDPVVHPSQGAGIISAIKRMPQFKSGQRYYEIEMLGDDEKTTLMVPLSQAEKIGLRAAVSKKRIEKMRQVLSSHPLGLPAQHKKRYKIIEDRLNTGELCQMAAVLRDLEWRRLQFNRLNVPAERMYKKAERLLVGEVAASEGISMQDAEEQIYDLLKTNLASYMA